MSTCISRAGEYSEHELTDPNHPLTCQRCFVFADDEANRRLRAARNLVGDWQSNGNAAHLGDPRADVWQKAARQAADGLRGQAARRAVIDAMRVADREARDRAQAASEETEPTEEIA